MGILTIDIHMFNIKNTYIVFNGQLITTLTTISVVLTIVTLTIIVETVTIVISASSVIGVIVILITALVVIVPIITTVVSIVVSRVITIPVVILITCISVIVISVMVLLIIVPKLAKVKECAVSPSSWLILSCSAWSCFYHICSHSIVESASHITVKSSTASSTIPFLHN